MNSMHIQSLQSLDDARFHAGLSASQVAGFYAAHGFSFPKEHLDFLRLTNGAEVFGGYFRLFGIHSDASIDSVLWNRKEHWKFAWGDRCSEYWCFGETAWGDQYAYSIEELLSQADERVYFLDGLSR